MVKKANKNNEENNTDSTETKDEGTTATSAHQSDDTMAKIDAADLEPLSEEDSAALAEELQNESSDVPNTSPIAPLLSCQEMREKLSVPIPQRLLKQMAGRGGSKPLTYLHWTTAKKFLDFRAPNWQYRISHIDTTELGVAVAVEISIQCSDGVLVGSGIGFKEHRTGAQNKPTGYGGAPLVAERQGFKRGCAMLGLGFGLYDG